MTYRMAQLPTGMCRSGANIPTPPMARGWAPNHNQYIIDWVDWPQGHGKTQLSGT